jgi:hypothetical protein
MQASKWAARIGAAFYVVWGLFHVLAANAVYGLAEQQTGMVRGRLLQDAFYLLFFALVGIVIALALNWRNDRQGYWMNGVLIAVADIPFVLFVLIPGLMPWWPGLAGPLLWSVAFLLTTVARFSTGSARLLKAPA